MRILNLGAGVQSTALFLMAHEGLIEPVEHAIFADTQEEPEAVYQHLQWLRTIPAPVPILHIATAGKLGTDLLIGKSPSNKNGFPYKDHHKHRFATIPCFTHGHHEKPRDACKQGMVQRQCTKEYKVEVVERVIRRDIFKLAPRRQFPKGTRITQLFGISMDEAGRAKRIRANYEKIKWGTPEFPLLDLKMTRQDCKDFLKSRVPHETPRSACVFCPYKSADEWLRTKASPAEWARAVEIDRALRIPGNVVNRNMDQALYLHRECIPLEMVDLDAAVEKERKKAHRPLFDLFDCGEGMCGV